MPEAQWQLGAAYAIGDSVPQDFVEAYKWLYIARKNGLKNARSSMEKLNRFSTEEQREAGRKAMREWFRNHPR